MYEFLDRRLNDLSGPHGFILSAMRLWVRVAREGQCGCRALTQGFVRAGVPEALPDFGMAMMTLDHDAMEHLRFGGPASRCPVTDDEARLLALFDAALAGVPARVRRLAAALVSADAVARLTTSIELVALRLSDGIFMERDR